jgi:transposase
MQIDLENASREELITALLSSQNQLSVTTEKHQYEIDVYQNKVGEYASRISSLEALLDWYKKQLYGPKSEKLIPQDPRQGTLFDLPEAPPAESVTVKEFERKYRKNPSDTSEQNTLRFDESVPVDEEIILPEEVKGLSEEEYEIIGEKVTNRLVQTPCQYRVKRTIRKTVKLKETKTLHTAPAPDAVIERSFADVSFLTGMLVDKFQYHIPLYRQHQRLEHAGVHISRIHMSRLAHRSLEILEPVYNAILSDVITSDLVCMDETPIKAGRKIKGKMHTAYFWPVLAGNQVAFVYSSSRAYGTVSEILGDKCKKLLSDGYKAYDKYVEERNGAVVHANCWAHARRKFFDAAKYSPAECEKVLGWIAELFVIERDLQGKPPDEVLSGRRENSTRIVYEIFEYLDSLFFSSVVDKRSPLGKAVAYTRDLKEGLTVFLDHEDIPLSNNEIERAIRPVAVGRKNWLFCWSEVGAKYAAIAFTLIESCKMNGVNPWEYIMDVLQRIDSHPARQIHLMTPKHWKELTQGTSAVKSKLDSKEK